MKILRVENENLSILVDLIKAAGLRFNRTFVERQQRSRLLR